MIYADQLLSFLEEFYSGRYSIEDQQGVDFLRIVINKENLKVEITFDATKQTIELNTFTGKTAVFNSLEVLATNLAAYFFFELQFKPQSKLILDKVMQEYRPGEEYKIRGIEGNATSALKLLTSTDITIVYSDNVYKAQNADGIFEAYKVDESGNIISVPALSVYVDKICNRYATSDVVDIFRLGDNTFQFNYSSGLSVKVEIIVEDNYQYNVVAVEDGYEGPTGVLTLDNVFDLEALASLYTEAKPSELEVENITEAYDMKDVEINVSEEDKALSSLGVEPAEPVEEINVVLDETVADIYPHKVEVTDATSNTSDVEVLSLSKILSTEGKLLYVRFTCSDNMYDVPASEIDLDIIEEEQQVIHKGVLTTPAELKARKRAKKVIDEAFISVLVNNFYS